MSKHPKIVWPLAPGELGALQLVPALGVMARVSGEGIGTQHHAGTGLLDWFGSTVRTGDGTSVFLSSGLWKCKYGEM